MCKKILRILSLALALLLLVSAIPASQTSAAQTKADALCAEAAATYKAALKKAGRYSFHGWCGTAVDYQLYAMGIVTKVVGHNGNDQFDYFKAQEYTTGGYRVRAYSAKQYTLKNALNAMTENGTVDVYNIVVGFQRTNTTAGMKYGHAVYVYAIVDGMVYFTESFGTTFNKKYYAEGTPIVATIDQFCKFYSSWTYFDGVIQFGLKTYQDSCEFLPAYLYATTSKETTLYSAPCTPDVDDRSQVQRVLQSGERLSVTGMYLNTEGEYWYQVEDAQIGYVRAAATQVQAMRYEDVTVTGIGAPSQLQQSQIFDIKGKIKSTYNMICSVRAQVFSVSDSGLRHVMTTSATVDGNSYSLSNSTVSNRLAFRLLDTGDYRYELAVVVGNHYFADGCLQIEWKTIKLWLSDFQVAEQKGGTGSVYFDACGGNASLNAGQVALGQSLGVLPSATREGYVFDGWYTAAEGGEQVSEDYVVNANTTLYAHWSESSDVTGWYEQDGRAYYLMGGQRIHGFFLVDGILYHQNAEGFVDIGWTEIDGLRYYFNANGSMTVGWLEQDGARYYFGSDGTAFVGWALIDDQYYYFGDDGIMLTGEQTIEGEICNFGADGALILPEA